MNANMFQSNRGMQQVGGGKTPALKQGSVGETMSDLQFMLHNERKQHEEAYRYEHGRNGEQNPLGEASF